MAADSKQNLKQLRVDNWAVFFLQRLQLLFAKGDCCDLTLKFVSGQELKVHRLVLSTSTSFFESMASKGNVINLPESLPYNVVQPIINFLYSGRLEFKAELHSQLLAIAKIMKLAILAKILVAQKNDNGVSDHTSKLGIKKVHIKSKKNKTQTPTSSYVNIVAGKKLPIWKKRTVPYRFERKPIKDEEPAPTRFEWPDDETCTNMLMASPSFSSLSYESAPVISPPVKISPSSLPTTLLKRRVMPPVSSIPDKIFKPDNNNAITINENGSKENDNLILGEGNISDDDDDDGHFETIHTYGEDSDDDIDSPEPIEQPSPVNQLKPILKPMSETPLQTPSKKVRFSFTPEDKENKNGKITEYEETPQSKSTDKNEIANHAKIIQEVLKKYPDLVKGNKNIKLKITAPGTTSKQSAISSDAKNKTLQTKSSYIVLKSAVKPDAESPSSSDSAEKPNKSGSAAKNVKGPWKCESCLSGKDSLQFDSYHDLRKHLQEAHLEKIDSRICEHCGYKASKRNLHLYHLFTKHGVDPPKNVKFPKCTQCSYIALSESLLVKHLNNHQLAKDLTCHVCKTTFRTHSSLHVHSLSCKPNSEARSYACPHCKKMFKTNVSLNAHVKVCSVEEENDEEGGREAVATSPHSATDVIEVPILETVDIDKGEHALVQIPSGIILTETPNVALLPSSESEALNNVASSIATSIGLTVAIPPEHQHQQASIILLDSSSQFFLQDSEAVVVSNDNDVEEYIVPDLLRDEMGQMYTTQKVPYTVSSTGVITCPVVSIESSNDQNKENDTSNETLSLNSGDHNYAEGDLKNDESADNRTTLLESDDSHLESSNTRVEIKDSQSEDFDVLQLQRALQSPEASEEITIDNNESLNDVIESSDCTASIPNDDGCTITNDVPEDKNDAQENDHQTVPELIDLPQIEVHEQAVQEVSEVDDDPKEKPPDENDKDKAITLVKDWGFDNEDESDVDNEEAETGPTRPTMEFEE